MDADPLPVGAARVFGQLSLPQTRSSVHARSGTLALPGDAARLREWLDAESGAVMIHDPHRADADGGRSPSLTRRSCCSTRPSSTAGGRVGSRARGCCRSGRIARLQVSERTLLDSGTGLDEWWDRHGVDDDSWAAATYRELIERAGPAGERHATTDQPRAGHGGGRAADPRERWRHARRGERPPSGDDRAHRSASSR